MVGTKALLWVIMLMADFLAVDVEDVQTFLRTSTYGSVMPQQTEARGTED